ncbi:MAG TPA: type VII secretion target [Mycobacteriales bacterium]|jgi:Protein of unknown function (DUF2580).
MGDQLEVHPPGLRRAGRELQDVAGRVEAAWQDLQNTVRGMGELFGDDIVGSLIGTSYHAAHDMAQESYTSVAEGLRDVGDRLVVMAQVYERAEQVTAEESGAVGRSL